MPKTEDIFARLADGKTFSKLDMSEAYAQLVLDEENAMLAAMNTSKGLMAVTRLPYGVSSASAAFQRHMDNLLRDGPKTAVCIDDIIIGGKDEADILLSLDIAFTILE